jgi:three-Cys-motif partner protein
MKLKDEHPDLRDDILLVNSDANSYLIELCSNSSWSKHRAVLFLDPFGMQVSWEAIKAIAATKAIDMWYLFPLGVGVNRMLKKDGNIDSVWRQKLNDMFGTTEWYQAFYNSFTRQGLFGSVDLTKKYGDFRVVSKFFIDRLKTIFAGVAENPLPLYNSKNNPMYLLCFASGNPRGAETAIKIAQSILKRHY